MAFSIRTPLSFIIIGHCHPQQTLQHEGVITRGGGTFYHTAAHNDADIDFTLDAYQRSLEKI